MCIEISTNSKCVEILSKNKMYLWNMQYNLKKLLQVKWPIEGHKVDLGVIWKGINSQVCMPNLSFSRFES